MKKKCLLIVLLLCFYYLPGIAQSFAINTDGSTANASALLDVKSITKGILIPRMTLVNRNAIATPATGLMIYQTDNTPGFYYYDGASWVDVVSSGNNLWSKSGVDIYNSNTGNVGIGTTTPLALIQVKNGAALFDGNIGVTPVSGAGTRMMWIPAKGAFRAGFVPGTEWDDANIGYSSIAIGYGTTASGSNSTAMGNNSLASGNSSLSLGDNTTATGNYSTAMGSYTTASGQYSTAIGNFTTAPGGTSIAMGNSTIASGSISTAMGNLSIASGAVSTAMGLFLKSKSCAGFTIGVYNDSANAADPLSINSLNRIFQVGNGTSDLARSNAMTILHNGNTGIGTTTPVALFQVKKGAVLFDSTVGGTPVSGAGTRMMWIPAKAALRAGVAVSNEWDDANIGLYSLATGLGNKASGDYSTVIGGFGATASGNFSTSIGTFNTATGLSSVALGNQNFPSGDYSTAIGRQNFASGINSIAMGYFASSSGTYSNSVGLQIKSKSYGGFVAGMYNDSTNSANATTFNNANRIFQIGNGTADNARRNAMTVLQNGNTGIGTVTPVARLHVVDSSVLFSADNDIPASPGNTPVSGEGRRMMWYPDKAAFRVGYVDGSHWDQSNIGRYSFSSGMNTIASGLFSTAFGHNSIASTAHATAMGLGTTASGQYSTAMGANTKATAHGSVAMNENTTASGLYSTAMGLGTITKTYNGVVIGSYNDTTNSGVPIGYIPTNPIFQIGNGTVNNARSNAITVLHNGNVGIGTTTPVAFLHVKKGAVLFDSTIGSTPVSGAGTRMMWIPEKAALRAGYINGSQWDDANIGMYSFASGRGTIASGGQTVAMGENSTAFGFASVAMGHYNTAYGAYSFAMGEFSTSSGFYSTSFGLNNRSKSFGGFVTGLYNDTTNAVSGIFANPLNRIFQIGNGTANNARSNAMTVLHNGSVGIGVTDPQQMLSVFNGMNIDQDDSNNGTPVNSLRFGSGSGEAIGSKRTAGGNIWGLDFYTNNANRMSITNGGAVQVTNNLTVQNGKGIIRNTDGTQSKKLSTTVTVNAAFAAGETKTFAVTWSEAFSAAPEAFVGNVTGGTGGWAEVVMTLSGTGTTGATLYVYNPRASGVSPNFTIKVIAIGAQ